MSALERRFSLFLRLVFGMAELELEAEEWAAEAECLRSSGWSSWSSFTRFVRDGGCLRGLSLWRGRSESGDFEFVDGAERRPERRISRGESGGPMAMVAACAIDCPTERKLASHHVTIPSRLPRPSQRTDQDHWPRRIWARANPPHLTCPEANRGTCQFSSHVSSLGHGPSPCHIRVRLQCPGSHRHRRTPDTCLPSSQ